jgi:nickel-dependent lactate racemase
MDTKKKFKNQKGVTRREFLGGAVLGGLLIGSASKSGNIFAASSGKSGPDKYQTVLLNTHEWFGDIEEKFELPKEWDVNIHHMAGHNSPVLSEEEIHSRINTPVNSKQLCEIASGKKNAVILFDDVTRATPAGKIVPVVINELKKGGIKDENILLVCMIGSHRAATQPEMRAKLGDQIVDN